VTAARDEVPIERIRYRPRSTDAPIGPRWSPARLALALAALVAALVLGYLLAARSVQLVFTPPASEVELGGWPALAIGGTNLMLEGDYRMTAHAAGYYPLELDLTVSDARNQRFEFEFVPLPGLIDFITVPEGASVTVEGVPVGTTPLDGVEIEPGPRSAVFSHPRYQPATVPFDVQGRQLAQSVEFELVPDWGNISIDSVPQGARILVDGNDTGAVTPATVEIMAGEHDVRLSLDGHKSDTRRILVAALEERTLETPRLVQADGILRVSTRPAGAGLTVDGRYVGATPIEIDVQSGKALRLQVYKAGYAAVERSVRLDNRETRDLDIPLTQLTGELVVVSEPADATLYVDGRARGRANQTIELPTRPHAIEVKLDGYAGYKTTITPRNGLTQEVKVRLLTLTEARLAALQPTSNSPQGDTLLLFEGTPIEMGASRREPGRRANETLHSVTFERLFYLATKEVTNAQFRAFAAGHDSGKYEDQNLNKDDQPVTGISWHDAARYCNWLSGRDGREPFYVEEFGKVKGFRPGSTGYRLPTEAEWEWAARQVDGSPTLLRYPWGDALPPPDRQGNYADRAAAHLVGRIIFGYNDNHAVAAPVGTFSANTKGLYDLGGNVSEWVHDFYAIPEETPSTDPVGPTEGEYHVVRGSSWMHGTATDLRLSFRDYGIDGRRDLGFRIARYAE
jgi:formylglycine-generating enzyme required for sulfatase activity